MNDEEKQKAGMQELVKFLQGGRVFKWQIQNFYDAEDYRGGPIATNTNGPVAQKIDIECTDADGYFIKMQIDRDLRVKA